MTFPTWVMLILHQWNSLAYLKWIKFSSLKPAATQIGYNPQGLCIQSKKHICDSRSLRTAQQLGGLGTTDDNKAPSQLTSSSWVNSPDKQLPRCQAMKRSWRATGGKEIPYSEPISGRHRLQLFHFTAFSSPSWVLVKSLHFPYFSCCKSETETLTP